MDVNQVKGSIRQIEDALSDMRTILTEGEEDAPLAFFEACQEIQYQISELMRAAFIAATSKPE